MSKRSPLRQALRRRMRLAADRVKRGGGSRVSVVGDTHVVTRVNNGDGAAITAATGRQESPLVQGAAETMTPDERQSSA